MISSGVVDVEQMVEEEKERARSEGFEPAFAVLSWAAFEALKKNRGMEIDDDSIDEVGGLPIVFDVWLPKTEVSVMLVPKASQVFG